jgi:general stress protein 26
LWNPSLKIWFDGPKDPNLVLLKVEPKQAHYWETINGKLVAGLKMLFASITGATPDLGREGELRM